jgi:hypothetical protein
MQIKTTLGFYLTPVRLAIFKNKTTTAGEDVAKQEPSNTVGGSVN